VNTADIAYVEHPMGSVHMEKEGDVAWATLTFERLRSLAMSPIASAGLIQQVAEQM
jgi:hypothetical protein